MKTLSIFLCATLTGVTLIPAVAVPMQDAVPCKTDYDCELHEVCECPASSPAIRIVPFALTLTTTFHTACAAWLRNVFADEENKASGSRRELAQMQNCHCIRAPSTILTTAAATTTTSHDLTTPTTTTTTSHDLTTPTTTTTATTTTVTTTTSTTTTMTKVLKCGPGSPNSCTLKRISVPGYSAGDLLIRIDNGIRVKKSTEANSCPTGWKIWSPRNKNDWTLVYNAMGKDIKNYPQDDKLIVDVTRSGNGCGGCTKYAMKSSSSQQNTWRTTDGSEWWLRDSKYNEPNGDYHANCYLNVLQVHPNDVRFNDANCNFGSSDYLCQKAVRATTTTVTTTTSTTSSGKWIKGKNGATCDQVCNAIGSNCDANKQSSLTSNAAVAAAFKEAGYTCKGFHGARDYAGAPFSTGRSDDCAPMKSGGQKSVCNSNFIGYHAALCYCIPGVTRTKCATTKYVSDNKCLICPVGYTCNGATRTKCPANKYVSDNKCLICPVGYTCNGATRIKCPAYKYVINNKCICPVGYTGSRCATREALKCPATKYVRDNKCLSCPVGYTCNGATRTKCPANKYVSNNKCLSCPVGYTCNGATRTKCPANKYVSNNKCISPVGSTGSGGKWMKGKNGATCDQACKGIGRNCKQSSLTSTLVAAEAFKEAGYTCKGFRAARACAMMIKGLTTSVCNSPTHAALCYCV